MRQVGHILRKDVRHFWPVIVFSWAALGLDAWYDAHQAVLEVAAPPWVRTIFPFVGVVLVISWWLLVIRIVQDEPLTGDRQFWVTRPYDWKRLLTAKVILVVGFVLIPAYIAGLVLLGTAGFPLTAWAAGGLGKQLSAAVMLMLPIAALATVTATLGQMSVVLVALGAYIAGIAAVLFNYIPNANFSAGSEWLQGLIVIVSCVAVIILQYARRRTGPSRWILAAAAGAVGIAVAATPYGWLIARQYPLAAAGTPVRFAIAPATSTGAGSSRLEESPGDSNVEITFPLEVSGVPAEQVIYLRGKMLTITAADGSRWSSGWRYGGRLLYPGQTHSEADFEIKKEFFEKVQSQAATVHLSLAMTAYRVGPSIRVTAEGRDFVIPDVGICSIHRSNSVQCRFALQTPPAILAQINSSDATCKGAEDEPISPGRVARDWKGQSDAGLIDPVGTFDFYFLGWQNEQGGSSSYSKVADPSICPGMPMQISFPQEMGSNRVELSADHIRLADYRDSRVIKLGIR